MFCWGLDQEILSELQCQDRNHIDAWCICCSQGSKRSSWSGLCMLIPCSLHRLVTQNFDGHYKGKHGESFLSQADHTIWFSRHRTLRTQHLPLSVFLWKYYIILASYKDFCKLQSFSLCTPLLTLTVFLFRHLLTEIVIFINVCYQIKRFSDDSVSFYRSRYC